MTKVRVCFFGGFRGITGRGEDEITVPERTTVRELLEKLGGKYGDPIKRLMWSSDGKLSPSCRLFLGDEEVSPDAVDREVGSEVNLFFVAAVGAG